MIKRRNTHIFYAADGRKLQENVTSGSLLSRRDYVGDFIYETGVLKRILFEGGYADISGQTRTYMFFLKDHLGSVRAVVSQMGAVQQTNEYYPFGDLFQTSGLTIPATGSDSQARNSVQRQVCTTSPQGSCTRGSAASLPLIRWRRSTLL